MSYWLVAGRVSHPASHFHSVKIVPLLQLRNWREVRCLEGPLVLAALRPALPTRAPKEQPASADGSESPAQPPGPHNAQLGHETHSARQN